MFFRVSPSSSEEGEGKEQRRVKTAPPSGHREGDESPPDPLEPWCTKDLVNINDILDPNDSEQPDDEPRAEMNLDDPEEEVQPEE